MRREKTILVLGADSAHMSAMDERVRALGYRSVRAEISGVVEVYGSRMEVPTGEVTLTEWYAPGVGLVLAKEERSQTLVFEDGTRMEYSERTQFALRSTDSPATAVPAAGEQ